MMKYIHKVQYYETDQMGFVHHSNYIRWFEEARIEFLAAMGLPYDWIETEGILSPVTEVECRYIKPTHFGETAEIEVTLNDPSAVRFSFEYVVRNAETGEKKAEGRSEHCFMNTKGMPIALKRERPELFEHLREGVKL